MLGECEEGWVHNEGFEVVGYPEIVDVFETVDYGAAGDGEDLLVGVGMRADEARGDGEGEFEGWVSAGV